MHAIVPSPVPPGSSWPLAQGLATALSANPADVDENSHTSLAAEVAVDIDLTLLGLEKVERVVEVLLSAVGFLSRLPVDGLEWVYGEMRDVAAMRFAYAETEREIDAVRRLAITLQRRDLPPDETLSAEELLTEWAPAELSKLLALLTPERLLVTVSHKAERGAPAAEAAPATEAAEAEGETAPAWQVEPWFGTQFSASRVSATRLAAWRAAFEGRPSVPTPALSLPPANEYIATDFALRHARSEAEEAAAGLARVKRTPPDLLHASARGLAFHKVDTTFATPKAIVYVEVAVVTAGEDAADDPAEPARRRVLRDLTALVTLEQMVTDSYAATLAGLSYQVLTTERGFAIYVCGFSHKLPLLLRRVCLELRRCAEAPCDAPTLERVLHDYRQALTNEHFEPASLAYSERLRCLGAAGPTAQEKLACLDAGHVTPCSLAAHAAQDFGAYGGVGGAYVVLYAGGNVDRQEARDMFELVGSALGRPPPLPDPPLSRCPALPPGRLHVRRATSRNPEDANCAVDLYWQLGTDDEGSMKLAARVALLEFLMYEPLFDALRTKQQLGYSISCESHNTCGTFGFLLSVVSATHGAADIEARALAFLEAYAATLEALPANEYATNQQAAIDGHLLDDKSIDEEACRYWFEIDMRTYCFSRAEDEAEAMRATSQTDLVRWLRQAFLTEQASRRLTIAISPATAAADAAKAAPTADKGGPMPPRRTTRSAGRGAKAPEATTSLLTMNDSEAEQVSDPAALVASLEKVPRVAAPLPAIVN